MLLGAVGAGLAVVLVLRAGRPAEGRTDITEGTLRVRADLHTGVEQALIGVSGSLAMVIGPENAAYGQLYLQQVGDRSLLMGSRSEIGRGFRAAITIDRGRKASHLSYAILRLPGDEAVHASVLRFELLLIEAVRRVDPNADVRLVGRALRDLDRVELARPSAPEE